MRTPCWLNLSLSSARAVGTMPPSTASLRHTGSGFSGPSRASSVGRKTSRMSPRTFFCGWIYSLDQLRTPEFEPWLYRLTVNAAYDYLRRQRRRHESRISDLSEQQVLMADAAAGREVDQDAQYRAKISERVHELLESVSEQDRVLLLMKEVEGLSLKELESIYNVKENALKVRLFRARQRVLKAFEARESASSKAETATRKV